jgi:hypothetical protein
MKNFHPLSFVLGLVSGALILLVVFSGSRMLGIGGRNNSFGNGQWQGRNGGPSLSRMAERLGISESDLQKELANGKTMQQIATEHGVEFGRGMRRGSGATLPPTGTGATSSVASSIAPSTTAQ